MSELTVSGSIIRPYRAEIIGEGRFGYIERLDSAYRLPDINEPLVFKRIKQAHLPIATASLRQIPKFRTNLTNKKRARWDSLTLWPLRVVTDSKDPTAARGILMRRLPESFICDLNLRSGETKRITRSLEWAAVGKGTVESAGVDYLSMDERHDLLRKLAYTLAMIHSLDIIYGDLSFGNVAFRRDSPGSVSTLLMDCDSVVGVGMVSPFKRQAHSPTFTPPENLLEGRAVAALETRRAPDYEIQRRKDGWARQSKQTDVYKFALLVMRIIGHGDDLSSNFDPRFAARSLSARLEDLLRASLSDNPLDRPTFEEWYRSFGGQAATNFGSVSASPSGLNSTQSHLVAGTVCWVWDQRKGKWIQST